MSVLIPFSGEHIISQAKINILLFWALSLNFKFAGKSWEEQYISQYEHMEQLPLTLLCDH
jgi:hypothetical protein